MRKGIDQYGLTRLIETCARDLAEVFVVGYDIGIDMVGVDWAAGELDVVAHSVTCSGAFDGILVGVGVLVEGVVADGHNVRSAMGIEFMSDTAWRVGIVINGDDEVVDAIVVEEGVENDVVPAT